MDAAMIDIPESDDFDEDAEALWAREIERRLRNIRSGQSSLCDWGEALTRMRAAIKSPDKAI